MDFHIEQIQEQQQENPVPDFETNGTITSPIGFVMNDVIVLSTKPAGAIFVILAKYIFHKLFVLHG